MSAVHGRSKVSLAVANIGIAIKILNKIMEINNVIDFVKLRDSSHPELKNLYQRKAQFEKLLETSNAYTDDLLGKV